MIATCYLSLNIIGFRKSPDISSQWASLGENCGGVCCITSCAPNAGDNCKYCKHGLLCYGDMDSVTRKMGSCGLQKRGEHFFNM